MPAFGACSMVAGGGAMHLDDAAGAQPGLEVVCTLHEQAAAIAAETYTKVCGELALCLVTTGPGGTNAVTGVAGAWLDSTPMLVVSGQVKRADLVGRTGVRQRGVQEVDIVSIVRPITKYAALVDDPATIRRHLEEALWHAKSGRPGPVWLDVPLDVQAAKVDPDTLPGFDPAGHPSATGCGSDEDLRRAAADVSAMLTTAKRPLLLFGAGVRLAGAEESARALVEDLGIPALSTWPAHGILGDDHPLFVGRPGPLAARGANFALQNADLLVCVGARLDMVTTGYDPVDFGRGARKVVVDIDPNEIAKLEGAAETRICTDARAFLRALGADAGTRSAGPWPEWSQRCRDWKHRYPVVQAHHRRPGDRVSTYHLAEVLSELMDADDVIASCSSGLAIEIFLLALHLRTGQRAVCTTALGAMGYGPPAAVGACLAKGGKRTIAVDGDGGLQLNAQELETIRRLDLPIKLLVLANDGYASIRSSQQRWFGRITGADDTSGLSLPPLEGIARAYGLPFVKLDGWRPLRPQLLDILEHPGPIVCEVPSPPSEDREPIQTSEMTESGQFRSRAIEDLAPLLDRDELRANLMAP